MSEICEIIFSRIIYANNACVRFTVCWFVLKHGASNTTEVENRRQILYFLTPVNVSGGVSEISEPLSKFYQFGIWSNFMIYFWRGAARPSGRLEPRSI